MVRVLKLDVSRFDSTAIEIHVRFGLGLDLIGPTWWVVWTTLWIKFPRIFYIKKSVKPIYKWNRKNNDKNNFLKNDGHNLSVRKLRGHADTYPLTFAKDWRAQTKSRKRPKKPNPFPIWAGPWAPSRPFLLYSPIHTHIPPTNLLLLYG